MLDLTCIDLATEEDKRFRIDYWASLFKAATWEEIKLLAQKDSIIAEKDAIIAEKDSLIAEKDGLIAELKAKLEAARHQ